MNTHPLPPDPKPTQGAQGAERPGHCIACGIYHGSVGAELNCLRATVRALRAALQIARAK